MTRIRVSFDEWWPVYEYDVARISKGVADVEVPDETLQRWEDTMEKFQEMQIELADIHNRIFGYKP